VTSPITPATAPAEGVVPVRPGVPAIGTTLDADLTAPDGSTRTYRVYVPSSAAADRPVPLLVALHGGGGSGRQFETNSGFDELAEANGFIVAYPDGTDIGPVFPGRVWNGGRCCGPAQADRDDIDDVGFIDTLIDTLKTDHPIDDARVYAAGHSNGAILSYRLACELADQIVAIGVQAGALEIDDCEPSQPVSVFHVHGTADTNVPIDGGLGSGFADTVFTSPQSSIATLAEADGCSGVSEERDPDNPVVLRRRWTGCRGGSAVSMMIIEGANHAWMGHPTTRVQEALVGPPFMGYDSSLAIWTFLAQQAR
jgi:polyhydroxybutyrate depolymerase